WEYKEGKERWTTEIVANQMQMLGERMSSGSSSNNQSSSKNTNNNEFANDDFDDDIPF
ncbi:MAG: single-stranded DNA-binding protein, partial [Gammaproteobacteria bacterium]|nr:single-stranded DNA-binding protein [Gammaproteobacteria bacterium]